MANTDTSALFPKLDSLTAIIDQPIGWIQMAIVVSAGLIAWLIHLTLGKRLITVREDQQGLRRITLGGGMRLLFPFSFLILVWGSREILAHLNHNTALLDVAVPLLFSLAVIRITIYLLRKSFPPSPAMKALENWVSSLIWIMVALYLFGWLLPLVNLLDSIAITTGETRFSLWSLFKLVFSIALFLIVALWLSALLENRLHESTYLTRSVQVGLAKTVRLMLVTLAMLLALNTIGIDLTALAVFGGALGVGLGFGLQRIASNFISGFILLFDRSIRPGDVISVGDSFGWVDALKARYIVVKDRDGVERLIPNENIITSEVTNWSYTDRNVRLKLPVQISYHDDPEQAMQLMEQAAKEFPRTLSDPPPQARLMSFGDNGIGLELRLWINDPENGMGNLRSDINLAIWRAFKEHKITIPFPQRDVHLFNQTENKPNDK